MANIHRINEDRRNYRRDIEEPMTDQYRDEDPELLNAFTDTSKDPLQESLCDVIKSCFPLVRNRSRLALVMFIIILIVFIIQLIVDGVDPSNIENLEKVSFLPINLDGRFTSTFCTFKIAIQTNHEIWRLVTSLFLHLTFEHIVNNALSTLILCTFSSILFGTWTSILLILLSGFTGNLYSECWQSPSTRAGGFSTALFGLNGALLGYLIFNWRNMKKARLTKFIIIIFLVLSLFISIITAIRYTSGGKKDHEIDNSAHFGGFVSGVFLAMFMSPIFKNPPQMKNNLLTTMKNIKIAGIILSVCFMLGSALFLFIF